jgi:ubiquinone/menaquinone biosynthesis C-methylase UbiE
LAVLTTAAGVALLLDQKPENSIMTTLSGLALPKLMSELHGRLDRSVFRSLGVPIFRLADQYGPAYVEDFEYHLELLRLAFPAKRWPEWAVQGYINLNKAILKDDMHFRETGKYIAKPEDLKRVTEEVYDNEEVMDRYYLVGLYCTYFLWPHHYRILEFFRRSFLQVGPMPQHLMEWGAGHGLLSLEALRHWPKTRATLVDLSRFSLAFAQSLLKTGHVGNRYQCQQGDVVELAALPLADRIICSELLEHVPEPGRLLGRLRGALAPGGMAYLTGAINAAQPDHVYLFTSDEQLFRMLEEHGLAIKEHLTACHPNREGDRNPPAVVAMVVEAAP